MCDGEVCLYFLPIEEKISTDDRIRKVIAEHLSDIHPADSIRVCRSQLGKPYLPQYPHIYLSVSHSGEWFVCAVSSQPVGVDLQEHTPLRGETKETAIQRYCKIAQRFFHRQETEFILEDPDNHFFVVWSAKESYVKYTGRGMDDTYGDFCVVSVSLYPQISHLLRGEQITWQAENVSFQMCGFDKNYTLCVCTSTPCSWKWHYKDPERTK